MAFRRRPRFRGRFRRPVERVKYAWANTVFNESAITLLGDINEQVLFEQGDWTTGIGPAARATCTVRRIVISGSLTWVPQFTAAATNLAGLAFAVYQTDEDDLDDNTLWSSQSTNSLLRNADRLLWTHYRQLSVMEFTNLQATNSSPNQVEVEVDLKVKIRIPMEAVLLLGIQFGGVVDSTIALAGFTGISRVLYEIP